ncbi:MAG: LysR family transcriptional regulator [Pseudomonadota bacterium]
MNWDDLRVILAISRAGSLRAAAAAIGVDQSTVSRRLTAIEAALGAVLFVRSKTGFRVTYAGEAAIAQALAVERAIMQLEDEVQASSEGPAGPIRLVANFWMINQFLVPQVPALLARHPRLQLRTIGETRGRSLSRREAELGLWFEMGVEGPEITIDVGQISYAVYCRQDLNPQELGWVTFWDDDIHRAPMRWLEDHNIPGEALCMTASDASGVTAAIQAGIGKGLIPICLGTQHRELVRLTPGEPDLVRTLHAIVHPDMFESAKVQAVLAWVREIFASAQELELRRASRSGL